MNGAELLVRCLEIEGVEVIYGLPGEENLDFVEALRTSKIQLVVTRHEQHAAFMAATHGRLTGRPGVCLATLGPGATNLATGIAHAQLGGFPLVAITGQKPAIGNWQGAFQIIDVVGVLEPLTKWNAQVSSAAVIPRSVRHAFQTALDGRPGAVHLEIPVNVAEEDVDGSAPYDVVRVSDPVADAASLDRAAEMIRAAERPIVIVSGGGNREPVCGALGAFLEATALFAVTTQMGKGALPEDHAFSLLCMAMHREDYVHAAIERADLVLTIGYDVTEYPPSIWNPDKDKRILHVDSRLSDPDEFYLPALDLLGDVGATLDGLRERLDGTRKPCRALTALRDLLRERLYGEDADPPKGTPLPPRAIVRAVRAALGREDVLCLDNGIYKLWFARHYPAYARNTVLLDNALATMGAGLALGMAAKLVHPERKVLAVCGDGGFLMNDQDVETAVRLKLDLVVLIVRDDAYGFIRWKQANDGFPDFAMTFGNPDFVKLAEAYGATGMRVGAGDDAREVLERALATRGPVLVDCPIDYAPNEELERDFVTEARALVAKIDG